MRQAGQLLTSTPNVEEKMAMIVMHTFQEAERAALLNAGPRFLDAGTLALFFFE